MTQGSDRIGDLAHVNIATDCTTVYANASLSLSDDDGSKVCFSSCYRGITTSPRTFVITFSACGVA